MVYTILAQGFEEIEALATVDLLRRAGIEVCLVGVEGTQIQGGHGITVQTEMQLNDVQLIPTDTLFLPGGGVGVKHFAQSQGVHELIQNAMHQGCYIAAICAAPATVLGNMGVVTGKKATCYPGMEHEMQGAIAQDTTCVVDGRLITGRAAGSVFDFALALCQILAGSEQALRVKQDICYTHA